MNLASFLHLPVSRAALLALAGVYILYCAYLAWVAHRSGRSLLLWFLLALVITPMLVAVYFYWLNYTQQRARNIRASKPTLPRGGRCPYCHNVLPQAEDGSLPETCPSCGQKTDDEVHLA